MKKCCLFTALVAVSFFVNCADSQSKKCKDGKQYSANDWACGDSPHTMCLYKDFEPAPTCKNVARIGLTMEDKKKIIQTHNRLRARVASGKETRGNPGPQPAGIIPPLKWDDLLAEIAQKWANQCDFTHDQCRSIDKYIVGQNLAKQYVGTMESLVELWYDEVDFFNSSTAKNHVFGMETGHYTQLVWGDTTHVGCGYIRHDDGYGPEFTAETLVCNYGPSGNYANVPVYKILDKPPKKLNYIDNL